MAGEEIKRRQNKHIHLRKEQGQTAKKCHKREGERIVAGPYKLPSALRDGDRCIKCTQRGSKYLTELHGGGGTAQ